MTDKVVSLAWCVKRHAVWSSWCCGQGTL